MQPGLLLKLWEIVKMRKISFLVFLFIILFGCSNSVPEITLLGDENIILPYWQRYTEPGFTANDEEDGDITNKVIITENFNYRELGDYSIIYTVSDSKDQTIEVIRTVQIVLPDYREVLEKYDLSSYDTTPLELNNAGFLIYKENEYYDAAVLFKAAATKDNSLEVAHYNLACMLSLLEAPGVLSFTDDIFIHLSISLDLYPERIDKILVDSDLNSIRGYPEYHTLVEEYKEKDVFDIDLKKLISTGWDSLPGGIEYVLYLNKDGSASRDVVFEMGEECYGNWDFDPENLRMWFSFDCSVESASGMPGVDDSKYSKTAEGTLILSSLTIKGSIGDFKMYNNPLYQTILDNNLAQLKVYVEFGVNIVEYNEVYKIFPGSLINAAIDAEDIEILTYLIDQGMDLDFKDRYNDDNTYLHYALLKDNVSFEIIQTLLENGLSREEPNANGDTPLELADKKGDAVYELLDRYGYY